MFRRSLQRLVRSLLFSGLLLGCAGSQPPVQASGGGEAASVSNPDGEVASILALRAPRYAGTGEKDDALRFVKEEMGAWVARRKAATQKLSLRYREELASDSDETVARNLHTMAELSLDFAREFIASGAGAVPSSIRADPETHRQFLQAFVDSAQSELSTARQAAGACLKRVAPESRLAHDCQQSQRAADAIARNAVSDHMR